MKTIEHEQAATFLTQLRTRLEDEHIVLFYRAFHHRTVTQAELATLFGRTQVHVSRLIKKAADGDKTT